MTAFLFAGCGYKPTTSIVKNSISGKVFIETKIDIQNLNNTVLMHDALIHMLNSKLDIELVEQKKDATSFVYGELKSISESILETDAQGFAKVYRESVTILVSFTTQDKKTKTFTVSNYYDFVVSSDSVVSASKKEEAIRLAIDKALSDVFSRIAIHTL